MYDYSALPRDRQSAMLADYRASLPHACQRFVEAAAGQEGTALDGSLPSLIAANKFFLDAIVAPELEHSEAPLPVWWDPEVATGSLEAGSPLTRGQLRLVDGLQAYAASIAESLEGTTWATFRGHKKDFRNGRPMLVNSSGTTLDIRDVAYGEALDVSYRGSSVPLAYLHDVVTDWAGSRGAFATTR